MTLDEPEIDTTDPTIHPLARIRELLDEDRLADAAALLEFLPPGEQRRIVSRLDQEDNIALLGQLTPEAAAELIENLPDELAASLIQDLPTAGAAQIFDELPDDVTLSVLREMDESDQDRILAEMPDAEDAIDFRERVDFHPFSAGSLMVNDPLSFPEDTTVHQALQNLGEMADELTDEDVQYVYVTGERDVLRGVLPLRNLVLGARHLPLSEFMISSPLTAPVDMPLQSLVQLFDERDFLGLPVVDADGVLRGVVSRETVREAQTEAQTEDFLRSSGIVGEELRSLPMHVRCTRRLAWLAPNIILNLGAASIIALYEDTLKAVIALAVFLPIVSDMSGCSGNQAVAVSIRELSLGILRPKDFLSVVFKEGLLGIINGLVLGILLGMIAYLWKGDALIAGVIGGALWLNTIVSVLLGGLIPLVLKKFKADPALASSPILTTCTDMCGFFLVLSLASALLL
jgi:magnesium transporter